MATTEQLAHIDQNWRIAQKEVTSSDREHSKSSSIQVAIFEQFDSSSQYFMGKL
jgi:hypothetical protein